MHILDPLINFPVTQYYFDTFIVGRHHSVPHLISDLNKRKNIATYYLLKDIPECIKEDLVKLSGMIDTKLLTIDSNEILKLEAAEPAYWVNSLGRQSALEISTYGRIKPETMNLLMCLDEDRYIAVMSIAGHLAGKLQMLGEASLSSSAPIPSTLPIIS
jgi:hypothetical protein